jgi:hypothetical protein
VKGEDTHTTHLLESLTHRESKEGLLFKEILVRVIKELHPQIGPKEKRASGQQQRDPATTQILAIGMSRKYRSYRVAGNVIRIEQIEQGVCVLVKQEVGVGTYVVYKKHKHMQTHCTEHIGHV